MKNTFLQDHPAVQTDLLGHDRTLVMKSARVFLDESLDSDGATVEFNRKAEETSALTFLEAQSGAEYQAQSVTGTKLATAIYGSAVMASGEDGVPAYFLGRTRSMLVPQSMFNRNLDNGHCYIINWTTDVITVEDRDVAARSFLRDLIDKGGDDIEKTAGRVARRVVVGTKRSIKLAPEIEGELKQTAIEAAPDFVGRVTGKLALGPGSF